MIIQLILPSELEFKQTMLKGVQKAKGGNIGIPDQIITRNLLVPSGKKDVLVQEWRRKFDFHLAEFQVDVNPNPNYEAEWVNIQGSLNPSQPVMSRPIVKDIFPSTEFVDPQWKLSGKFGVSASLGFDKLAGSTKPIGGSTEGEAKIEFDYAPKIAKIDSGTSGSNFHWNFRSAQKVAPVGGLALKLVIMRPRDVQQMQASFEVAVGFDRQRIPLIGDDVARAAAQCSILFNPGPI